MMEQLPHHYRVTAAGAADGPVELRHNRLPVLRSASPSQFGGPGNLWSPETLLVAALADCFILTFRAIARASKLSWLSLECDVTGTLDRTDGIQFTRFDIVANLTVDAEVNSSLANRALEKAERSCLISNSLKAPIHLTCSITPALAVGAAIADR